MTTDMNLVEQHARRLFNARTQGQSTDLVTEHWPDVTPKQALQIAKRTLALIGDRPCGIKLGYTSEAMRRQMNIDRPNFGQLTKAMDFSHTTPTHLIHPRAEPEVALRLARDIARTPTSDAELLRCVDAVFPALEIVDTRYHDYVFRFEDNVADNSSSAGFVLGEAQPARILEGDAFGVTIFSPNGDRLEGQSSAAMGGPLHALRWLCEEFEKAGEVLAAGSIILTGGLTAAPYLVQGQPITAEFERLGTASFTWR